MSLTQEEIQRAGEAAAKEITHTMTPGESIAAGVFNQAMQVARKDAGCGRHDVQVGLAHALLTATLSVDHRMKTDDEVIEEIVAEVRKALPYSRALHNRFIALWAKHQGQH